MGIYGIKKKQVIALYLIFGGIAVYCILSIVVSKEYYMAWFGVLSLILLYVFARLANTKLITTDAGIQITNFLGVKECSWDEIYSVETRRLSSSGNYSTILKWATAPQYRNKETGFGRISEKNAKSGVLELSDHYEEYLILLREITRRATNADIDDLTRKILNKN